MIFLINELLKWQGGAGGSRTSGQPWAPQHGDPGLTRGQLGQAKIVSPVSPFLAHDQIHPGCSDPPLLPVYHKRHIRQKEYIK